MRISKKHFFWTVPVIGCRNMAEGKKCRVVSEENGDRGSCVEQREQERVLKLWIMMNSVKTPQMKHYRMRKWLTCLTRKPHCLNCAVWLHLFNKVKLCGREQDRSLALCHGRCTKYFQLYNTVIESLSSSAVVWNVWQVWRPWRIASSFFVSQHSLSQIW